MSANDKVAQLTECIQRHRNERGGDKLREGQLTFVALSVVDRAMYDSLLGTSADCYFDNNKLPAFYEAVMNEWGKE